MSEQCTRLEVFCLLAIKHTRFFRISPQGGGQSGHSFHEVVDSLYYGSTCPCCAGIQDASLNISLDEDMLAEVLEEIYNEKVKPAEGEIPRKYYEASREKFEEATAQGMAQSKNPNIADDKEFLKKYRHSIDVFSAFRSHAYAKRLADELYDSEGKLRPFEEWCKATESIQSHFNKNWLQTEYNTAVLRAEQAADWRHFEDNKEDFPCLKWMPTSSATPREQHKAFWDMGLTLPVDDKFWDKHHPGALWNCKCYLEPTTAEPTSKKRIPKEKDAPKPAKGLESNPGKKAEMYSRNHPYYPQPQTCIWLKLAKGGAEARLGRFFNAEEVKCPGDCNECDYMLTKITGNKETNKKLYEKMKLDKNYKNVVFDPKTGGLKAEHIRHKSTSRGDKFFLSENGGKGWSGNQLEKKCLDTLFEGGHSCILLEEKKCVVKGYELTALDIMIDGIRMDIRSVTSDSKDYRNRVTTKNKQLISWNDNNKTDHADSMCLYFHDPALYTYEKMKNTIKAAHRYMNRGDRFDLKHIYVVIRGEKEVLRFDL